MTETTIALIVTNVVMVLGGVGKALWDIAKRREDRADAEDLRRQDLAMREQDRLDREQLAKLTLEQLEQVKAAGNDREKKIVGELIKTRGLNITALKAANGVNEKIADGIQKIADAAGATPAAEAVTDGQ
ncbi:MAG: hypothetical protein JWO82_246 [Akkermansiaceae bacterium]|nr:hypothetical protein [Akkermansiaceae bacterium]